MYKEGINAYIKGGLLRLIIMVWRVSPWIVNNQKGKRNELELISRNSIGGEIIVIHYFLSLAK